MNLLLAILLCYGITNIIVNGSIFAGLRDWLASKSEKFIFIKLYQLISCMMCMGFWVGAFIGVCGCGPYAWWNILFNGAILSGTTWIINAMVHFLGGGYDPSRVVNMIHHQGEGSSEDEEEPDSSDDEDENDSNFKMLTDDT